ncbi:unnamed protein product [Caenorhabditis angaria]|uniref:Serpentine Receptor, class BC (Class B-like) n=1 Tax=Caenorhabditis angaria TaxID=860376 RepID=A0A9P1IY66_9PELO|nr:unnamed protein product [Caenorhabditis angaria]
MTHWFVTWIGIIAACLQIFLNIRIFIRYRLTTLAWQKVEFQFIVLRTFLDLLLGISNLTLFCVSFPILLYPGSIPFDALFYVGLVVANFTIIRSFLAAAIAIERCIASEFPIKFYQHRRFISNYPFFVFFIFTAIFDDFMLFGFCGISFPLDSTCATYLCITPTCYKKYAKIYALIYGLINYIFSFVLCCKLLSMYFRKIHYTHELKKANSLCITDGLSSLIFDFLPAIVGNMGVINADDLGPIASVLRTVGRVFEAAVMYKLMSKYHSPQSMSVTVKHEKTTNMKF